MPLSSGFRRKHFSVLAYHRVNSLPASNYPFEEGTISATPSQFEKQILFVKKHFNVINFNVLSRFLRCKKRIPHNALVITFDDGYADNYHIAFPILKKYGLTATVFVATGKVNSSGTFWFEELTYMCKRIRKPIIELDHGKYVFSVETSLKGRRELRNSLMKLFRSVPDKERIRLFEDLRKESDIKISQKDFALVRPITWWQLKEMHDYGIEIGSHTVNHPVLVNQNFQEVMAELLNSKRSIERVTGAAVKSIAYPAGYYNESVIDCARKCGYVFGLTYEHDVKRLSNDALFTIPRIHVETDVTFPLFQANLMLPEIFVRYGS